MDNRLQMKTTRIHTLMLCFLLCVTKGFSQQYFKLLEKSDKPYEQKITRFSNGDLLIAGSPIRGKTASQNGGLNILRLDQCGNTIWSKNFQWKENFMSFKDFSINSDNEIYIYGTAYEGMSEYIFLLKLDQKGKDLAFKVFHFGTVDNFTYNIKVLPNGGIMAYGLLLDYSTPKRGFLVVFDANLNQQWGKLFAPFESSGEAIITKDNGFLGRSGVYTFKFNAQGQIEWSSIFESGDNRSDYYPVSGPVEVEGGYVFEVIKEGEAFFYKIAPNGQLLWKSELFPSSERAADVQVLENGDLLAMYNHPGKGENYPTQLWLSAAGKITRQRRLLIQQSLQTDGIYQSINAKGLVTVIGTQDLKAASSDRYAGFLLQTALDSNVGRCFSWEDFRSIRANPTPISVTPQTPTFFPLNIRNVDASIGSSPLEYAFAESCDLSRERLIRKDRTLSCGQKWTVQLPSADFFWEDGSPESQRTLDTIGTYRATDYNCIAPTVYEYRLNRQTCPCPVYLPNAFSPNADGHNDLLEMFSNCNVKEIHMSVYNRWGDRIYESKGTKPGWDGTFRQNHADPGVYMVAVRYVLINESNEKQEGTLLQNVALIR